MTAYPTGPEAGIIYTLQNSEGYQAVFNDSTSPNFAGVLTGDDAISGLESPEIRESYADSTEQDGGVHGAFYMGRRPITLSVEVVAATPTARNLMLTRIQRASMSLRADGLLKFTPSGSIPQQIAVRRQQPVRAPGGWKKRVLIPLVAADPRIYSQASYVSAALVSGAAPVALENQGSTETFPTVRITGPGTAPRITNGTRTVQFKSTYTLTAGQYVDLDLHPQRRSAVDQAGADVYNQIDWLLTSWWGLLPGAVGINAVELDYTSGATGASTATFTWRDAWA